MASHLAFALAFALAAAACGQDATKLAAEIDQLKADVRDLKLVVTELQVEGQKAAVARLEGELDTIRQALERLSANDAEREQQLRETEEQLASGSVTGEQRMDIQAIRSSLVGERYAEIIQQRNNLLEREARIRKRLAEERQRLDSRLPVTR
jgi:DNA repair exonuclease SbcCD ATPase subunit